MMKKVIFIGGFLLINVIPICAQASKQSTRTMKETEEECIQEFLTDLSKIKGEGQYYIGNRMSKLYYRFAHSCFKSKHMSTMSVGPWSQPDGKEYMTGVILYNNPPEEMDAKEDVFVVYIDLGVWIDDRKFWNSLPDDDTWIQAIQERTKDMIVKDISFEKTKIYSK